MHQFDWRGVFRVYRLSAEEGRVKDLARPPGISPALLLPNALASENGAVVDAAEARSPGPAAAGVGDPADRVGVQVAHCLVEGVARAPHAGARAPGTDSRDAGTPAAQATSHLRGWRLSAGRRRQASGGAATAPRPRGRSERANGEPGAGPRHRNEQPPVRLQANRLVKGRPSRRVGLGQGRTEAERRRGCRHEGTAVHRFMPPFSPPPVSPP